LPGISSRISGRFTSNFYKKVETMVGSMGFNGIYPPVSASVASWKKTELNGGFLLGPSSVRGWKKTERNGGFNGAECVWWIFHCQL
jgi:hypothetical protein